MCEVSTNPRDLQAGVTTAERSGRAEDASVSVELERRLRAAEGELTRVRARLERVEGSTAYQVAALLVEGARHPRRALLGVPRELFALYRRWRARGGAVGPLTGGPGSTETRRAGMGGPSPGRREGGSAGAALGDTPDSVGAVIADALGGWLGDRSVPVVAAVTHPRTLRTLTSVLPVTRVPPTGGRESLERLRPDLLLVDASASLVGAWAGFGSYGTPARERQLLELLARAVELGTTTVLWDPLGRVRVPFLHDVATFHHVLSTDPELAPGAVAWHPGVDLAEHFAVPTGDRPWRALVAGDLVAAAGRSGLPDGLVACGELGLRVLADQGAAAVPAPLRGLVVPVTSWSSPWPHTRVAVPLPFEASPSAAANTDLVAALVAGARVVSGPRELPRGLAPHVARVDDARELAASVADQLAAGPLTGTEHREVLRTAFLDHRAPVRVAELFRLTGVGQGRQDRASTAVLLPAPPSADAADEWTACVLGQRWRPSEVLVADHHGVAGNGGRIAQALNGAGVDVRVVRVADAAPWWLELARRATTPWVHVSDQPPSGSGHLLDLALAADGASADAAGASDWQDPGGWSAVPSLPLGGALVARHLLLAAPPASGGLAAQRIHGGRLVLVPMTNDQLGREEVS